MSRGVRLGQGRETSPKTPRFEKEGVFAFDLPAALDGGPLCELPRPEFVVEPGDYRLQAGLSRHRRGDCRRRPAAGP